MVGCSEHGWLAFVVLISNDSALLLCVTLRFFTICEDAYCRLCLELQVRCTLLYRTYIEIKWIGNLCIFF